MEEKKKWLKEGNRIKFWYYGVLWEGTIVSFNDNYVQFRDLIDVMLNPMPELFVPYENLEKPSVVNL